MNYASSISKNHLQKCYSNFFENQSSACDDSLLSLNFCAKVLGKPCFNYKKAAQKNDKKLLENIKKVVTVYTLIEETANPFVTERESKDSTASKIAGKPIGEESTIFCAKPSMSTQFNESIFQEQVSQSELSLSGDHPGFKKMISNKSLMEQDETEMKDSQDNTGFAERQSIYEPPETQKRLNKRSEEVLVEEKNKRHKESEIIQSSTKESTTQTPERRYRPLPIAELNQNNNYTGFRHRTFCYCDEVSKATHRSTLMDSGIQGIKYPVKNATLGVADKAMQTSVDGKNESHTRGINTINTDSVNVQVTEVACSKTQTSNTGSMDAEISAAPIQEKCSCYRNTGLRKLSSPESFPKYTENGYPRSEKYGQKDNMNKEPSRELCSCCCYCCCQSISNGGHCSCENCYFDAQQYESPNHRKCTCADYYSPDKPPPIPPYDISSYSDNDEDYDIELLVDRWDDTNSSSSENSVGHYRDLPYQNSEDYEDLVQELEESLQIRSRNRIQRAFLEFEKNSRCNKPLEKPIINYEEPSESEEPIIRKISELRERRKKIHQSFPCKGRACCTYRLSSDKEGNINEVSRLPFVKNEKPVKRESVQTSRNHRTNRTCWRQDKETGEWYKVSPPLSTRLANYPPYQKADRTCSR